MLRLRDVAESCERLRKVAVVTSRNLPKHSLTFRNIGNHGVILLSVLIILLTISLIGASLMSFFFSVDVTAQYSVESAKAFYLAEAGIAHAVFMLHSQAQASADEEVVGPIILGDGTYEVTIDYIQSAIVSVGRVGSTKKILQLQYNAI